MDLCYALMAGYPVLGAVVAVLWKAYLAEKAAKEDAQRAILLEKEHRIRELEALRELMSKRTSP